MGRYYEGDIEGKFWFAIQNSDDGTFFGAKENAPCFLDYSVPAENLSDVINGIWKCKKALGNDIYLFGEIYTGRTSLKTNTIWNGMTEMEQRYTEEWSARLNLGMEILGYMLENPDTDCTFTAET